MQYTETSFKFPMQVGSLTLKSEQISAEEANQSSYILLLMSPSSRWNTRFFGIDTLCSKDLLPLTTACIACLLRYDIALTFQCCAPWSGAGGGCQRRCCVRGRVVSQRQRVPGSCGTEWGAAFYLLLENNLSRCCIYRLLLCSWFVTGLNCGSM